MILDMRLVAKGRTEPRHGLAQQGKTHVGLAQQYADELEEAGWTSEDTDELEVNVERLEEASGTQAKAYDGVSDAATTEVQAIDAAKKYIRRLRHALPRALREAHAPGVTIESFYVGETLGRSTPKISKYLSRVRPAVVALDGALKRYFKGKKASNELDAVKSALDEADTAQELSRKNAPVETLALYQVMGKVLQQIEDLNRAGKSAFDGDPVRRAKFNKEILIRARRERKKKGKGAPPVNDEKGAPDTPSAAPPPPRSGTSLDKPGAASMRPVRGKVA